MTTKLSVDVFKLRRLAQSLLNTWRHDHGDFVSCEHCEQAGVVKVNHDSDCPVRFARKILRECKFKGGRDGPWRVIIDDQRKRIDEAQRDAVEMAHDVQYWTGLECEDNLAAKINRHKAQVVIDKYVEGNNAKNTRTENISRTFPAIMGRPETVRNTPR